MAKEHRNILQAKRRTKFHIAFLEGILSNLKSNNKVFKTRALFAAWCMDNYIRNNLISDVEEAIKLNASIQDEQEDKQ